ncbi:unnamed protein product [Adineta steineri]|uniref:Uncharacterized protein n=1 Tax=Adineta steineri TaxID=433720 RepID=A0A818IAP5_9BILA|nr:unnamed protein product [Adineta steineri]CAF1289781.1 unnamed protein product [Adineta steineri]CAF3523161.1 unnamed protein product [Adineta steineri]CAF3575270.1 unnamed protein product [Adineta steineri]
MTTLLARFDGAFVGHAIASNHNSSVLMASNLGESLLDCKGFNGPDILSRYLYLYHVNKCEIGEITKYVYQQALTHINTRSSINRKQFLFDQSIVDEFVKAADKKYDGYTAGCGPVQRSFPLAFCAYISDEDLADISMAEAKLTHYSPLAGQVAAIVNCICRGLLKNQTWHDAVNSAFTIPNLHEDIRMILGRHARWSNPATTTHPAFAPTVLNAALHYVSSSKNAAQAIAAADAKDRNYCAPIVGILAGARWGIPEEMFIDNINNSQLKNLQARLTHFSSHAEQVSGTRNIICRRLIKRDEWNDAINFAFENILSSSIKDIQNRYQSDPILNSYGSSAFASNILHVTFNSFTTALEYAYSIERDYCPTLVGLLASARLGIMETIG